jgi:hypothetical protein
MQTPAITRMWRAQLLMGQCHFPEARAARCGTHQPTRYVGAQNGCTGAPQSAPLARARTDATYVHVYNNGQQDRRAEPPAHTRTHARTHARTHTRARIVARGSTHTSVQESHHKTRTRTRTHGTDTPHTHPPTHTRVRARAHTHTHTHIYLPSIMQSGKVENTTPTITWEAPRSIAKVG